MTSYYVYSATRILFLQRVQLVSMAEHDESIAFLLNSSQPDDLDDVVLDTEPLNTATIQLAVFLNTSNTTQDSRLFLLLFL